MLFDKLCGFAEKYDPKLLELIQRAHLFYWPGKAHETLPKELEDPEILEMFHLPFDTVVCEDSASAIMVSDTVPEQSGFSQPRLFVEIMSAAADPAEFADGDDPEIINSYEAMKKQLEGHYLISYGMINSMEAKGAGGFRVDGSFMMVTVFNDEGIVVCASAKEIDSHPELARVGRAGIRNAVSAIEQLFVVNQPSNMILEDSPSKQRKIAKGRVARSHDRPIFTLLSPKDIRAKLDIPEPQGTGKKRPHERRRHFRTLKSERYKTKKGQRIIVKASWIGESEKIIGKRHYKIRLDV